MIIQIAGTSGSGKSHLVRTLLERCRDQGEAVVEDYREGRSAPLGYFVGAGVRSFFVCGAYEAPTGGCDTIHNVKEVFELVSDAAASGRPVLFEGLFCMNQTRGPQLAAEWGRDYNVMQLTTPLAECLRSIDVRRAVRGAAELSNTKNTVDNYKRAENFCVRMRDAGATVHRVSREEGLRKVSELLGIGVL